MSSKKKLKRELAKADALIKELNRIVKARKRANDALSQEAADLYRQQQAIADFIEQNFRDEIGLEVSCTPPYGAAATAIKLLTKYKESAKTCVCGEPSSPNTVHRVDGPCYVAEGLVHTGETMDKVFAALSRVGLDTTHVQDAVIYMQNAGIYFREAVKETEVSPSTHCPKCGYELPTHNRGCEDAIVRGKRWPPESMETKDVAESPEQGNPHQREDGDPRPY